MKIEDVTAAVKEAGYDEYKEISFDDIVFDENVFSQCKRNTCGMYGKNYACPPRSGSMEDCRARLRKYTHFIIINKIVNIKEDFNGAVAAVQKCADTLRELLAGEDAGVMAAGPCKICGECAALTDEPCRFPDKTVYSMEGSGMDVVRMSLNQHMTYNGGGGKIGYFALVVFN